MKNYILLFFLFADFFVANAQDLLAYQPMTQTKTSFNPKKRDRKRFSISHQPFLVLTASPLNAFDFNNNFMVGAELAPPGKFSLQADYGTGNGTMNINKIVREQISDMKTTIMRGELKAYFSDWHYFSNLDRKPLGRYWAIEFAKKNVDMSREAVIGRVHVSDEYAYYEIVKMPIKQNEQVLNLKLGTHLLLQRFVIFDLYGGIGLRKYKVSSSTKEQNVLYYPVSTKYKNWLPNEKGILPNLCAGFRICLAL